MVIEIGPGNGRDARFFAREKKAHVFALDFSQNAIEQLSKALKKESLNKNVFPVQMNSTELGVGAKEWLDVLYARSSLHIDDQQLDELLSKVIIMLKKNGYIMIEGKSSLDYKIKRSREVKPHIMVDIDGHERRVWDLEHIEKISRQFHLQIVDISEATEIINGNETKFINCILQKT